MSSATFDEIVPVAIPDASVTTAGCVIVLPVPVEDSTTAAPGTGLLYWSSAVTVTVVTSVPLAITVAGTTPIVETPRSIGPGTQSTKRVSVTWNPSISARTTFCSATVEAMVPVAMPSAPVTPTGSTIVLPVPVASSVTEAPSTRLPSPSLTVTVTPSRSAPSAVTSLLSPDISERSRL